MRRLPVDRHADSSPISAAMSIPTENCSLLPIENCLLRAWIRAPRRGVGGVGLDVAVGYRVGAATATSLAATTRQPTAGGRHRCCFRFVRRSRRTPLAAPIRAGLQKVLMVPHPVAVAPNVGRCGSGAPDGR